MTGELNTVSEHRSFGGVQGYYSHSSPHTRTPMKFAVFLPPAAAKTKCKVLWYLSGLTCTEDNFTVKAGAQQFAAQHDLIIVAPDTSPRGAGISGEDDSYDFGTGAGFYVDATESPWSENYRMYSYVTRELQELVIANFSVDDGRQGITGHSMGGHGALIMGLRNPELYRSVSAFAPICAPIQCPWGQKALRGYLGADESRWADYDATELVRRGHRCGEILIDQGEADGFLSEQLKPHLFSEACEAGAQPLRLRLQPGYDHSYFFIASFIADHIRFHVERLDR